MATNQYRLFRSTDLTHWSVLTNIMMPPPATYTHLDSSPFVSPVFYRAAWVP
jgi:hypothetical protein